MPLKNAWKCLCITEESLTFANSLYAVEEYLALAKSLCAAVECLEVPLYHSLNNLFTLAKSVCAVEESLTLAVPLKNVWK